MSFLKQAAQAGLKLEEIHFSGGSSQVYRAVAVTQNPVIETNPAAPLALSNAIDKALSKALSKDPTLRHSSMNAFEWDGMLSGRLADKWNFTEQIGALAVTQFDDIDSPIWLLIR